MNHSAHFPVCSLRLGSGSKSALLRLTRKFPSVYGPRIGSSFVCASLVFGVLSMAQRATAAPMLASLDLDSAFIPVGDTDLIVPLSTPVAVDASGTFSLQLSPLTTQIISIILPSVHSPILIDFTTAAGETILLSPAPPAGLGTSVEYRFPLVGRTQDRAIIGTPTLNRLGGFSTQAVFFASDFTPPTTDFRIRDIEIAYDGTGLTFATAEIGAIRIDPGDGTARIVENPVPEPSSLLTAIIGTVGLGLITQRRRKDSLPEPPLQETEKGPCELKADG